MNPQLVRAVERGRVLFRGFTTGQRTVLVVAAVGLVLGAVVLTRFAAQPSMGPLFSNLSATDASAVVDQLKSQVALASLAVTLERKRVLGPLALVGNGVARAVTKLFVIR